MEGWRRLDSQGFLTSRAHNEGMARRKLSLGGRVVAAGLSVGVAAGLAGAMAAGDHGAHASPV